MRRKIGVLLAAFLNLAALQTGLAQGTAIFYQGRLSDGGAPANTNYDFRFAVFDAPTNGALVSGWVTNRTVPVSNGLFSVTLDFGPGVFNGTSNGSNDWMDIAVRPSGGTAFTALTPRQPILPVPYAIFATSASNLLGSLQATQLVGTISSAVFSGTYSNGVNFVNGTNKFAGTFTGTFAGDGGNVTNLNATYLVTGTLADARLPADVARLGLNQVFTGSNSFAGPGAYSGVNNFTNNGNSFTGNFFGNGLVGWTSVSGTAITAVRDHGYMLTSASSTTVTLPSAGSLTPVDIVRVSGAGTGGWQVQETGGESIVGTFASYRNSVLVGLPAQSDDTYGIAASADGSRIYTVGGVTGTLPGVWATTDQGMTWVNVSGTRLSGSYVSVACSANGKIVYAEPSAGTISKSTDFGNNWSTSGQPAANGLPISCTADGSTLLMNNTACSGDGTYQATVSTAGAISYKVNGGAAISVPNPASGVRCLAVSSDCSHMVAGVSNGLLYATSNFGSTWVALTSTNQVWTGAWMSPDGSRFMAADHNGSGISGGIVACTVVPEPNTANTNSTISGSRGSAVELQYIGNSQFIPVSSSGLLWSN